MSREKWGISLAWGTNQKPGKEGEGLKVVV